jgi:4-carboxymuconolactone decarboxylase
MAELPDPLAHLDGDDRREFDRMAAVRGEGRLGQVYVAMWNNPSVARLVGQVGEHLRYHGVLPDDVRELAILYFARKAGLVYEWAHHQAPARAAGLTDDVVDALAAGRVPETLRGEQVAALHAVDAVLAGRSIPDDAQETLTRAFGTDGVVELVVLVGLYRLIGGVVTSFDINVEPGLPATF